MAFRDLAKLAIWLEKTRMDEMRMHPNSQFGLKYVKLEQQFVYWLLCELHNLMRTLNLQISQDIVEEVEGLPHIKVLSAVDRYRRDFKVLELLDDQLHNMIVKFQVLAESRTS